MAPPQSHPVVTVYNQQLPQVQWRQPQQQRGLGHNRHNKLSSKNRISGGQVRYSQDNSQRRDKGDGSNLGSRCVHNSTSKGRSRNIRGGLHPKEKKKQQEPRAEPERPVVPGDQVYVRVFRRKWHDKRREGPYKVTRATRTVVQMVTKQLTAPEVMAPLLYLEKLPREHKHDLQDFAYTKECE
ncbi:hypothetical protein SKAU_G00019550 [Synaphobranchus kaupii]|uniref:Uncharacterized protein n=1 Tax=Synaphobranchus kaupii TaxID=118154 RepID=A0A9Q1JE76_SYNKA|nr:hypothetical protein SKAU_G00019550 [Synaphobranchus kaupii]